MAILPILHYPDPRLRNKALPVEGVDAEVRALLDDMLETMYEAPGIGLAAPQVNVSKRAIVIDISEERNEPVYLVNPEILSRRGEVQTEEGCLSVPYIYEPVERAAWVKVRALGRDGRAFEREAEGLLAVCIQHEIDHLEGKLFVDYLSEIKRSRIRKKLEKFRRKTL
jgi:peptide deformylase